MVRAMRREWIERRSWDCGLTYMAGEEGSIGKKFSRVQGRRQSKRRGGVGCANLGLSHSEPFKRAAGGAEEGAGVVLPLLKAELLRYRLAPAQFAGTRVKSGLKPAGSIDKIGWEFYIAGVLPIGGGSGRCMERRNHGG